jgi:hypothetical protein
MITEFSALTGVSETDIAGNSRQAHICDARHVYWFRLHERYNFSRIAQICRVNHTTVLHGVNRVNGQKDTDKSIKRLLEQTKNIWIMKEKKSMPALDIERVKEVHYNSFFKKLMVIMDNGDTVVKHGDEAVKLFKELSNG